MGGYDDDRGADAAGDGAGALFGVPYLALLTLKPGDKDAGAGATDATLAAVAPFGLAFYLASTPAYAGRWALLFGFVAILDAVLVTMALWRRRSYLLLVAAVATSLTQVAWGETALGAATLWGGTLCTLALAAALGVMPRLWARRDTGGPAATTLALLPEWAGLATLIGLVLFAAQLVQRGPGAAAVGVFAAAGAGHGAAHRADAARHHHLDGAGRCAGAGSAGAGVVREAATGR